MPTNEAAKKVADIIKIAVVDVALTAAKAALHASAAWTNLPVVKQIIDALMDFFVGKFCLYLQEYGVILTIYFQVEAQRTAYQSAESSLRAAYATGEPARIEAALEEFKHALRALIHYDGDATIT